MGKTDSKLAYHGTEEVTAKGKLCLFLDLYELHWGPWGSVFDLENHTNARKGLIDFVSDLTDAQVSEIVEHVAKSREKDSKPRLQPFIAAKKYITGDKAQQEAERQEAERQEAEKARQLELARKYGIAKKNYPGDCEIHHIKLAWNEEDGFFCPLCRLEEVTKK